MVELSYFPLDRTFQGFESSKLCDLLHTLGRKKILYFWKNELEKENLGVRKAN